MKKGFIILVSIAIMVFGSVSLFAQYGRGYGMGYGRGYSRGYGCNYGRGYGAGYRYDDRRYYNQRFNGYNGCYYYNNEYVK